MGGMKVGIGNLLKVKAELERKLQVINEALEMAGGDIPPTPNRPFQKGHAASPTNPQGESLVLTSAPPHSKVTNADIRYVIAKIEGEFTNSDVEAAVRQEFPQKILRKTAIPSILHSMKADARLKVVSERNGRKGFTYLKAS